MTDAPQQPDHAYWKLVLYDGPNAAEVFPITGNSLTIGRELDNDISLDSLHVSKHHARLTWQGEQLIVEDLNSVNGTLVNDELIAGPTVLRPDDTISLAPFTFRVEGPAAAYIPQSRLETRAYAIPRSESKIRPELLIIGGIFILFLMALIVVVARYWLIPVSRPTTAAVSPDEPVTLDLPTIIVNQAPANDSQVSINHSRTLQATASDPSGVTRMELWVNGSRADRIDNPLAQGAASMTAAFQWSPDKPGPYTIEIRAYNRAGLFGAVTVASLTAVGDPDTPTPEPSNTPTPTITPLPPSATPAGSPTPTPIPTATPTPSPALLAITIPVLNVRTGPGTQYNVIGQVEQGGQAEIMGQADAGQGLWWQIRFDAAPGGLGWVSANPNFSTAANATNVKIVSAPPLPTARPANRPGPTATVPSAPVIRAPDFKTLLIVSNRSLTNHPARLTLSGGKSVGGGREIDVAPNSQVEIVLEPDHYRALWSSPARGHFVRGADFTAVAGKVMVMWIVPEDGLTLTEVYDQLKIK